MELRGSDGNESRFEAYVQGLVSVIGHADRASPLRDYCVGLVMPCERKSVEPIAATTAFFVTDWLYLAASFDRRYPPATE